MYYLFSFVAFTTNRSH